MPQHVLVARLSRGHLRHTGGPWWACIFCDSPHRARSDGDEPDEPCQCANARRAWRHAHAERVRASIAALEAP